MMEEIEQTVDEIDVALDKIQQAADKAIVGVVIDQSGSMNHLAKETIDGFNEFLQDQQRNDVEMVVTIFDSQVTVTPAKPVKDVLPLEETTYHPQAMTALLDAIGMTIMEMEKHPASKRIMCIITDGQENQSREYNAGGINKMVKERQDNGWDFVFMGAGLDSIAQAQSLGVPTANAAAYAASRTGTRNVYQTTSNVVTRGACGQSVSFTEDERIALATDDTYDTDDTE